MKMMHNGELLRWLLGQFPEAAVAWDRDIAPLLETHFHYWGDDRPVEGVSSPWVSLQSSRAGAGACCHLWWDPDAEAWVRVTSAWWLSRRQSCLTPELP